MMSKKIISLLVACLMVMSFAVIVSAENVVTLTVGTVDAISATTATNIDIPIMVDRFPSDDVATVEITLQLEGYEQIQAKALGTIQKGDIVVGMKNLSADGYGEADIKDYATGCSVPSWASINRNLVNEGSEFVAGYLSTSEEGYYSNDLKNALDTETNTLTKIRFVKKANDVTGTAVLKIKKVVWGDSNGNAIECTTNFVDGGAICSETVEPDPEPVATAVKTFAKRLYLDNTLYTVGVISEGTNYATETIKAGIRIDKAGVMVPYWTNNAPVSDGKGTSYYAVALNGVTAETDIKAESVSKAVITVNGGAEISGDEVSANDTSVE